MSVVSWTATEYKTTLDSDGKTWDPNRTGTYQIITAINTIANTTSTRISLIDVYGNYTPPLTNSDGRAMQAYTWMVGNDTSTTTV
jgi:hypothetical protein